MAGPPSATSGLTARSSAALTDATAGDGSPSAAHCPFWEAGQVPDPTDLEKWLRAGCCPGTWPAASKARCS